MKPDEPASPRAFVLCVGDELLRGVTQDTNSLHIFRALAGAGALVVGQATVGDDLPAIQRGIRQGAQVADLVVITGGIGPTPDDVTREALAGVAGQPLVRDEAWVGHIAEMFRRRGRQMHEGNRRQADVPRGGRLLWNPVGTAAGIECRIAPARSGGREALVFVLPGVPEEMQRMLEEHVLPAVRRQAGGRVWLTRALHTFGLGESDVAARLGEILARRDAKDELQVGTTAAHGIVSIRIYAGGADESAVQAKLDAVEREVRSRLGEMVFGRDAESLPQVVGKLLREHPRRPMLTLAESCTGGLIAKLITDVASSSDYFARGLITYANEAKTRLLGVPDALLAQHGAVSEPVAEAMARGALAGEAGVALSVTGIAGPGGGSEAKPVGTVCIALADGTAAGGAQPAVVVRRFLFPGDRESIRRRSALMALAMLRLHLMGSDVRNLPL